MLRPLGTRTPHARARQALPAPIAPRRRGGAARLTDGLASVPVQQILDALEILLVDLRTKHSAAAGLRSETASPSEVWTAEGRGRARKRRARGRVWGTAALRCRASAALSEGCRSLYSLLRGTRRFSAESGGGGASAISP